jgi:hypothetical protein
VPELHFAIEGAEAVANAAAPLLALKLRITNFPIAEAIHTLTLRCQVQIEPARRSYVPREREQLLDLFGTPERWSRTVRPLLWMNTKGDDGVLQIAQIPWDREANFKLPIAIWKEMMDTHFPNSAWLSLRRDTFEQLYEFKVRHGLPTWEQAIERALAAAETEVKV